MKKTLLALAATVSMLHADPEPFAFVEISSFNKLQADVSALATDIGQPAMAMALVGAGQFLGSPGLLGIDRERPIRLVFTSEHDALGNQPIIIVPLSDADGANYLQSLATLADQTGEQNGVRTFRFKQFPMVSHMRVIGGHAVFAMEGAVNDSYLTKVADDLAADPKAYTISGLSGTIRAQLATKAITPLLEMAVREGLEAMEDEDAEETRTAMRGVTDKLLDMLRGANRVALGLDYTESLGLSIWSRVDAKAESPLQEMFANFKKPSDRVLPYIGGTPLLLSADGTQAELIRQITPSLQTILPLLGKIGAAEGAEGLSEDQINLFTKALTQQSEAGVGTTASVLRFDDSGRPMLCTISEVEKPDVIMESYKDSIALANANADQPIRYGEPATRTVGEVTVNTIPVTLAEEIELPEGSTFGDYIKENPYAYEFAAKDGLFILAIGPVGSLDSILNTAPAPEAPVPLKELFPDMNNIDDSVLRYSFDLATILHDVAVFANSHLPEGADRLPEDLVKGLAADPGRIGGLALAQDESAVGVLRISHGFFRMAADVGRMAAELQRRRFEAEMQNGGELKPEDLKDLTDEDLDKLLDDAAPANGNP